MPNIYQFYEIEIEMKLNLLSGRFSLQKKFKKCFKTLCRNFTFILDNMVDVIVQKPGLSTSCHSLSTLVNFAYEILFDHVLVQCN